MRAKRWCSMFVAISMLAGICAGCGSNNSKNTMLAETKIPPENVVELTFYNADGQEDPWTDPVAQVLTEKTGVRLKTLYPASSDDQSMALMLASGNYPDLIYAKGDAGSLIEAGALIDMTEMIRQYGPNIRKMYGQEFDKLKYSVEDPSVYQLSSYSIGGVSYESSGTAQIQWAVLKENGYRLPDNLQQYEQLIRDYLAAHPVTEDGMDRIGITLSVSDWHWMITLGNPAGYIAEAAPDNGQWLIDEKYNAQYKFRSDKVREYFRWLNRMYWEGVLDPEFASQSHEEYINKIASGRVVALLDTDWDYGDGEKLLKAEGRFDKTYAGIPLVMEDGMKAPSLMYQGLTTGQGVGITTACTDVVAAVRFLDYLCSDEGQVLVNWGIKDVNYLVDEKGRRYRTEEEINQANNNKNYGSQTGVGFHTYPFPAYGAGVEDSTGNTYTPGNREAVIAGYDTEQRMACVAWNVELLVDIFPQPSEFEVPKYSAIWAYTKPVEFDEIGNKLDEIAWKGLIDCVVGSEFDFTVRYDRMLHDLEDAGMSRAESMLTEIVRERAALSE